MSLRAQLTLAFLALTILPLGGLATFSYVSSSRAVTAGLEEEAADLASKMDAKLSNVREHFSHSMSRMDPIPIETLVSASGADDEDRFVTRTLTRQMGRVAPLVSGFQFVPAPPTPETGSIPTVPSVPPSAPSISAAVAPRAGKTAADGGDDDARTQRSIEIALESLEDIDFDQIVREMAATSGPTPPMSPEQVEAIRKQTVRAAEETQRQASALEKLRAREIRVATPTADQIRAFRILGTAPSVPVVGERGEVLGSVTADLRDEEILREIFLQASARDDEIPFALDSEGNLYSRNEQDEARIREIGLDAHLKDESEKGSRLIYHDWVVATTRDEETGLIMGVARPSTEAIAEVRKATVRSFGLGLGLVAFCLIGVIPLAGHMTRDIESVTRGAEQIAEGDLETKVEVRSGNEVGRLAAAFNRMSSELQAKQTQLIEEGAARRAQEMREGLLAEEYRRTSNELEDARQFQLSMLPSELPDFPTFDLAVQMRTATEVGGDYYDVKRTGDAFTIAVGDGTGHGAKAGTMVAIIKSLFTALHSSDIRAFLGEASATIRSMQLGRMSMAMTLLHLDGDRLRCSIAGMPPVMIRRSDGEVEELAIPGAPLGTIEFPYEERELRLQPGDVVIAMTDGLPELANPSGEPYGYDRLRQFFADTAETDSPEIVNAFLREADRWRQEKSLQDDITILALCYRG